MDKAEIQKYLQSDEGQELLENAIRRYVTQIKEVFVIQRVSKYFFKVQSKQENERKIIISSEAFIDVVRELTEFKLQDARHFSKRIREGEAIELPLDGLKYSFEPAINVIHRIYLRHLDKILEHQRVSHLFKEKIFPYIDKFINGEGKDEDLFQDITKGINQIQYEVEHSEMYIREAMKFNAALKEWDRSVKLFHLNGQEIVNDINRKYMVTIYYWYEQVQKMKGEK